MLLSSSSEVLSMEPYILLSLLFPSGYWFLSVNLSEAGQIFMVMMLSDVQGSKYFPADIHPCWFNSIRRPANTANVPIKQTSINMPRRRWSSTIATNFHSSAAWERNKGDGKISAEPCLLQHSCNLLSWTRGRLFHKCRYCHAKKCSFSSQKQVSG